MTSRLSSYLKIKNVNWLNFYTTSLIFVGLAGFLAIRTWMNICFFLLLIPALFMLPNSIHTAKLNNDKQLIRLMIVALTMPFLAVMLSQLGRNDWLIKAYDGPSRVLLAIPVLLYFVHRKINFSSLLGYATPITLIATIVSIKLHPEVIAQWGGRYATTFVDPNSFGLYTVALTSFCLFNLDSSFKSSKIWLAYQLLGLMSGLYLILGSGTRGSWLALPIILMAWLFLNYRKIGAQFILIMILVIACAITLIELIFPETLLRFQSGFAELHTWLNHTNVDTSTGIRLNMWKISWDLFIHSPLLGYGDKGFFTYLSESWVNKEVSKVAFHVITCCGPHNEWLASVLRNGLFGLVASIGLLAIPLTICIKHLKDINSSVRLAAQLGLGYLITLLVCSISMEIFNLKYASTFYGLVIAGLIGQILSATNKPNTEQFKTGVKSG